MPRSVARRRSRWRAHARHAVRSSLPERGSVVVRLGRRFAARARRFRRPRRAGGRRCRAVSARRRSYRDRGRGGATGERCRRGSRAAAAPTRERRVDPPTTAHNETHPFRHRQPRAAARHHFLPMHASMMFVLGVFRIVDRLVELVEVLQRLIDDSRTKQRAERILVEGVDRILFRVEQRTPWDTPRSGRSSRDRVRRAPCGF